MQLMALASQQAVKAVFYLPVVPDQASEPRSDYLRYD
jgi:hypothetical protein